MLKLISPKRAEKILCRWDGYIAGLAGSFHIPKELVRAVLYKEMTDIDILDPAADIAVLLPFVKKHDSSVGYGQIFSRVAINALNFAVGKGITDYPSAGIPDGHTLDPDDPADLRMMWQKLHRSREANILFTTLNLLAAADEMTGSTDFARMSDEELKLVLTRYNANVRHITAYGEEVFRLYRQFLGRNHTGKA